MDTLPLKQMLEDEIEEKKQKGMTERDTMEIACRLRDHLYHEELTRQEIADLFTKLPH